jgi:hypothetical protein
MNWREVSFVEERIVNQYLKKERVELEAAHTFSRYAKTPGDKDKLVQFEKGVTFRLLKFKRKSLDSERFYFTFFEPQENLFMQVSDKSMPLIFEPDIGDLLNSVFLYAIKQWNRAQLDDGSDDSTFGTF